MLVSVIMSVFNSDKYLDDAINSILNQTYTDFEFIIINDGSNDDSKAIIDHYASIDKRIVVINNERNLGLAASLNKAIELSRGKYIARQDADDLSCSMRLEVQIAYALAHEEVDLIGSNNYLIDVNGEVVYENKTHSQKKDFLKYLLNSGGIFTHGSVLIKKEKLFEVGMYDQRFYYSQDGELWLRFISKGAKIKILDEPLYYFRSAPRPSNKKRNIQRRYNVVKRMMYLDKKDKNTVEKELDNIRQQVLTGDLQPRKFHMADYWRSLANAAYLHNAGLGDSYKYLLRAIHEENSLFQYPKYLFTGICYFFPVNLIRRIMNFQ